MNENDVRRVLSEKKEGFNVEAGGILHDVKYDLNVAGIEKVRVINRYDVSGVTDEEFENAKPVVFSEPPVDILYDETVDLSDAAYVLIIESLPGQYDQRADSAAQCIQFMTAKERPIVKCARIIAFYGSVSDEEKDKIKGYLINPVEAREASAEKPATLVDIILVSVPDYEYFSISTCSLESSCRVDLAVVAREYRNYYLRLSALENARSCLSGLTCCIYVDSKRHLS